ncbi:MAG: hypothetical protein PUK70_00420 [Bacteroidales bacterium]|nr:hypothetical protein [Bacteroidales bacterium]MDY6002272.1 hypothetical protein [Candidatus Cryptobacteroides sp.]
MTYSKKYIAGLLKKFMNGETSLDEENALHEYFSCEAEIPSQWRDYKAMFEYFDKGMPVAPISTMATASEGSIFMKSHRFRNIMLAACMVGVAVGIALAVLAPKRHIPKAEDTLALNIRDSSTAASEGAQAETPIAPIPENITSEPVLALPKFPHVVTRQISSKPVAVSAQAAEDVAKEELVKQIRQQVIKIAAHQAKAKIMDAVLASQGFVRAESENGAVVYVINNDENTIAL